MAALDQALPTQLLAIIGQYLPMFTLISASGTSRAINQAFSSDAAWDGSKFAPTFQQTIANCRTYTPSSMRRLTHLIFDEGHWTDMERVLFNRLPTMVGLLTLENVQYINGTQLQKFPALKRLVLIGTQLAEPLLTALTEHPQLQTLQLLDECEFETRHLVAALPKFTHTDVSLHINDEAHELTPWELSQLLPAWHYLHDLRLDMLIESLEDFVAEHGAGNNSSECSSMRRLQLSIHNTAISQTMTASQVVLLLMSNFAQLTTLDLSEQQLLTDNDVTTVSDYCRSHNIALVLPTIASGDEDGDD